MEILFVRGPDDTAALKRFHCDLIGVYGVREVTDPPLETGFGVLAYKYWLQKQSKIKVMYKLGVADTRATIM